MTGPWKYPTDIVIYFQSMELFTHFKSSTNHKWYNLKYCDIHKMFKCECSLISLRVDAKSYSNHSYLEDKFRKLRRIILYNEPTVYVQTTFRIVYACRLPEMFKNPEETIHRKHTWTRRFLAYEGQHTASELQCPELLFSSNCNQLSLNEINF